MKKTFLIVILCLFIIPLVGCTKTNEDETKPRVLSGGEVSLIGYNDNTNQNINQNNSNNNQEPMENENITQATFKTNLGDITVKFYGEDSPKTVANFVKLAKEGFYDGIKFHRIIEDFMIQAGDPLTKDDSMKASWGTGGPGYSFEDEFNSHPLVRGSLAMANAGPNTNGSQFFIVTAEATPWLDGKHTNFGEIVSGIEVVEKIEAVATEGPDRPIEDVVIESIELK